MLEIKVTNGCEIISMILPLSNAIRLVKMLRLVLGLKCNITSTLVELARGERDIYLIKIDNIEIEVSCVEII